MSTLAGFISLLEELAVKKENATLLGGGSSERYIIDLLEKRSANPKKSKDLELLRAQLTKLWKHKYPSNKATVKTPYGTRHVNFLEFFCFLVQEVEHAFKFTRSRRSIQEEIDRSEAAIMSLNETIKALAHLSPNNENEQYFCYESAGKTLITRKIVAVPELVGQLDRIKELTVAQIFQREKDRIELRRDWLMIELNSQKRHAKYSYQLTGNKDRDAQNKKRFATRIAVSRCNELLARYLTSKAYASIAKLINFTLKLEPEDELDRDAVRSMLR